MRVATVTIPKGARVVDSAFALTAAQIHALGAVATCRYYAPYVNGKRSWKALTPAEIAGLHAGGVGIIPNWESSATRPLAGAAAGSADGREFARQLAIEGVPLEVLVIISCDTNATKANRAQVEAYFRAAFGELRRVGYVNVGVYGDTDLFAWLADIDPRPIGWLMASRSFSDGTTGGASLRQRLQGTWGAIGGVSVSAYDPNDVLVAVKGVWLPHVELDPPAAPVPAPSVPDVLPPVPIALPEPMEDKDDMLPLFTHSDADHDGHPARWTFWALDNDGTRRRINEAELAVRGGRDTAPAIPMALVDTIPET